MTTTQTIVSREQWLEARTALLAEEKRLTRERDALARRRRELPWVRIEKNYLFDTPAGKRSLAELFDGRSQLVVYHFMLGPGWPQGCPSCSMAADGFDAVTAHLAQRDVTFMAVSRAPLAEIETFRKRMGWRFNWASSHGNDFNRDFHVSFTPQEMAGGAVDYNYTRAPFPADEAPGASVFARNGDGDVFHTYSTYARGLEPLLGAYFLLDLVPKGRDEADLAFPMAWVRHHDRYETNGSAQPADGGCPACAAAGAQS